MNAVKYVTVTTLVFEFNMCTYDIEHRPKLKSQESTTLKHINVLLNAGEADGKNSIGYVDRNETLILN